MFDALCNRAKNLRRCLVDTAINAFDLQAQLSARYGYGLTLNNAGETLFFHLPDVATNAAQARMLRTGTLPGAESLLRLRRRTHADSVVIDTCCGYGARAVFYGASMKAKKVYALGSTVHDVALTDTNAPLNTLQTVVYTTLFNMTDAKIKGACTSLDRLCKDHKLANVDVVSLTASTLTALTGGGATELLDKYGPAVIFWGQGTGSQAREDLGAVLSAHGYAPAELWTSEVAFWASRI